MTDFTNVAALVAQGQSLLDLVKGGHITQLEADNAAKLGEVDAALAAKIAQANTDIAAAMLPINEKLSRLQLTKNQELKIDSGTVANDMVLRAGVTSSLVATISGDIGLRDASQVNLLSEISADVIAQFADFDMKSGNYHISDWNVVRLTWDFGAGFSGEQGLGYLGAKQAGRGTPFDVEYTAASFVKLESGGVQGHYFNGVELDKWRFCNKYISYGGFGAFHNFAFTANTQTGSVLIALPVVTTGIIDHPHKLFKNIELL
jgi:hypothetical protein